MDRHETLPCVRKSPKSKMAMVFVTKSVPPLPGLRVHQNDCLIRMRSPGRIQNPGSKRDGHRFRDERRGIGPYSQWFGDTLSGAARLYPVSCVGAGESSPPQCGRRGRGIRVPPLPGQTWIKMPTSVGPCAVQQYAVRLLLRLFTHTQSGCHGMRWRCRRQGLPQFCRVSRCRVGSVGTGRPKVESVFVLSRC